MDECDIGYTFHSSQFAYKNSIHTWNDMNWIELNGNQNILFLFFHSMWRTTCTFKPLFIVQIRLSFFVLVFLWLKKKEKNEMASQAWN